MGDNVSLSHCIGAGCVVPAGVTMGANCLLAGGVGLSLGVVAALEDDWGVDGDTGGDDDNDAALCPKAFL